MPVQALLLSLLMAVPVPPLTGPVVDQAGLLSVQDRQRISTGLRDYQQRTTNQLQVLIVPSLPEDMPIEEYSIRVVEQWKLGTAEKDNGVLLLISVQDRKWRIEVGNGIEGELPDVAASRIGHETLVPAFKRGDYAGGIAASLERIANALGGTISFQGMPRREPPNRPINFMPLLLIAFLILFAGRRRRGGFLAGMILGNMMGGRGGSSGGGGGWSGGGGGFSGGGAGGSW